MKKMKKALYILVLLMLSWPLVSNSQTTRGDFDYDGRTNIGDVTALINYLLGGQWDPVPPSVVHETVTVNGFSFVMVHVAGGSITMSDGVAGTVSDFSIGQTEVTNRMWYAVMGTGSVNWTAWDSPKTGVSWDGFQEFIARLNELTGLQFRMPSSLEWSYAARGGRLSSGYVYAGSDNPILVAWYDENTNTTSPRNVGLLKPNELGLYDMSGNVSEWVTDLSDVSSGLRVIRGGDYMKNASQCTVTWSGQAAQNNGNRFTGLRLAL